MGLMGTLQHQHPVNPIKIPFFLKWIHIIPKYDQFQKDGVYKMCEDLF